MLYKTFVDVAFDMLTSRFAHLLYAVGSFAMAQYQFHTGGSVLIWTVLAYLLTTWLLFRYNDVLARVLGISLIFFAIVSLMLYITGLAQFSVVEITGPCR